MRLDLLIFINSWGDKAAQTNASTGPNLGPAVDGVHLQSREKGGGGGGGVAAGLRYCGLGSEEWHAPN